jgi:hypothetical protein
LEYALSSPKLTTSNQMNSFYTPLSIPRQTFYPQKRSMSQPRFSPVPIQISKSGLSFSKLANPSQPNSIKQQPIFSQSKSFQKPKFTSQSNPNYIPSSIVQLKAASQPKSFH